MTDYGGVMEGLADAALESAFGADYIRMDSEGRKLVLQDFLDASTGEKISVREYHNRIGEGNLTSYVDTLRVHK